MKTGKEVEKHRFPVNGSIKGPFRNPPSKKAWNIEHGHLGKVNVVIRLLTLSSWNLTHFLHFVSSSSPVLVSILKKNTPRMIEFSFCKAVESFVAPCDADLRKKKIDKIGKRLKLFGKFEKRQISKIRSIQLEIWEILWGTSNVTEIPGRKWQT